MAIVYYERDIFLSPATCLVNPVNLNGVMGKGLAAKFKSKYPDMFAEYRRMCQEKKLVMGKLHYYRTQYGMVVLNFPTKINWWTPSQLEFIELGLIEFTRTYREHLIDSVTFPRLGCGEGGLIWSEVQPVMEKYLKLLPIDVFIYSREG